MKKCSTCKEMKPFTDFYNRLESKDGKHSMCKVCCETSRKRNEEKNKFLYVDRKPYIENTVKPILKYYNVEFEDLFSSRMKKYNLIKTMIYVKLVEKKISFKQIGLLVDMNHSTIIHHYNKYLESEEFKEEFNKINALIFKNKPIVLPSDLHIKNMINKGKHIQEIADELKLTYDTVYRRIKLLIKTNGVKKLPIYSGTKNHRKVIN